MNENARRNWLVEKIDSLARSYCLECFCKWDRHEPNIIKIVLYNIFNGKSIYILVDTNEVEDLAKTFDDVHSYVTEWKDRPELLEISLSLPYSKPITAMTDHKNLSINKVVYNYPATIVLWSDGTKTVVKAQGDDVYDPEKGLAMAICKKHLGNYGNYYEEFKKWLPEEKSANHKDSIMKNYDRLGDSLAIANKRLKEAFLKSIKTLDLEKEIK